MILHARSTKLTTSSNAFFVTVRPLARGEIHLWRARVTDAQVEACRPLLSAEERTRAARFRFARDQRMATVSRGLRRRLLAEYIGVVPEALRFDVGPQGKPRLAGASDVEFNVSHSGDLVVFAFSRSGAVGVDVEKIDATRDLLGMARVSFSAFEQRELERLEIPRRCEAFHRAWAQKEAFIKWIGMGVQYPLTAFDVSVDPEKPVELLAVRHDAPGVTPNTSPDTRQCVLSRIAVGGEFAGALATDGHPDSMHLFDAL